MFDLKKEIEEFMSSLVVISDINATIEIIGNAAKNYKNICYVSFGKPYYSFLRYFRINEIDANKFFFIDCITKSVIKDVKKEKNCVFISNPIAFREINDTIQKNLSKKKFDILIFDSLSSLLIYEKELFVTRFLHNLTAIIKGLNCKSLFIILEKDAGLDIVKNLGMLTDKTIYI